MCVCSGADGLEGGWEAVKETLDQTVNALRMVSETRVQSW